MFKVSFLQFFPLLCLSKLVCSTSLDGDFSQNELSKIESDPKPKVYVAGTCSELEEKKIIMMGNEVMKLHSNEVTMLTRRPIHVNIIALLNYFFKALCFLLCILSFKFSSCICNRSYLGCAELGPISKEHLDIANSSLKS